MYIQLARNILPLDYPAMEFLNYASRLLPPNSHLRDIIANSNVGILIHLQVNKNWTPVYWLLKALALTDTAKRTIIEAEIAKTKQLIDSNEDGAEWRDCGLCGKKSTPEQRNKKCARCQQIYYCSRKHQQIHWLMHMSYCSSSNELQH
jgi:hypothetical protein